MAETQPNTGAATLADKALLVLAAGLAAAGIWGYYLLADYPLVLRVLAVLGGFVAALAVGYFSGPGRQFAAFAGESIGEVKKVVWPTRKETMQTTGIVFLFVITMAVFLWGVDSVLLLILKKALGTGE